ncbi:transport-associated protein [Thermoanaerobacter ethanolicus JW 200]|uniref:Putative periplasmic or secreted lipoprotein n=1 Tax=Thermoanaerobacter siderophilus SR4 TaxID=880478 RepID=I9KS20_9THEO|nr:BON domain-containing protein [Thermoanaerobacter siderophilus]EGD51979.1 transport-associated protein [Thermoanaerobacter ethanolicus JW 200]EIV99718.1 putative periplasmic or secreted lipoprotein [Thermoanaerobacter siderophilus SR4]HHY78969.1 BON domain-containing protein [Thermoanaerobacter sp.]
MNKDKIIEKNIKEKLEKERVSYGVDVNVRCINGHVTLYGIVDNLSEKNHAQKIAESVEGVKKVENNITIAIDSKITDKDIKQGVLRNLQNSKFHEEIGELGVDVTDGTVTLYGKINNAQQEIESISQAAQAMGVKSVISKLELNKEHKIDDVSLVNLVVQKLSRYDLSLPDLVITANNGTVTLRGYVNNLKEKELANEAAQSVNGVKKVINHIKIREKS